MTNQLIAVIAAELGLRIDQVTGAVELLDAGNTIPFIARYRKEATGGLDEVQLRQIETRLAYLRNLSERKQAVLASIEEQGKLTPELRSAIEAADTLQKVEDLYLPYRPRRRTRATIARERGLEPLAERMLEQGAAVDIDRLAGGFLNDASVRIPLPGVLGSAAKGLRAAGQGKYVDALETTMNRAAEEAVPETLGIVKDTVKNMTLDDVRGILGGGDDAATQFLRKRAGGSMRKAVLPIVSRATDSAGATVAYKTLKTQADGAIGGLGSLGGLVNTNSLDLDGYVTDKALDGLFLKLAAEEKAIRQNPLARSTDLLKTVFGK